MTHSNQEEAAPTINVPGASPTGCRAVVIWATTAMLGMVGAGIAYWMIFVGKVTATWGAALHPLVGGRVGDIQYGVDLALFSVPAAVAILSVPAALWCAASVRGKRVLAVLYGLGVAALVGSEVYRKNSVRLQQLSWRDVEGWLHQNLEWIVPSAILLVIVLLAVIAVVLISIRRHQITADRPASRQSES